MKYLDKQVLLVQEEQETLLKSNSFIDKIFLIEKIKGKEKLIEILKIIISQIKEEEKENLIMIMKATLKEKIGKEQLDKLIKEMKGEETNMLMGVLEMLEEEEKRMVKQGIKQTQIKMIKAMKKNNLAIELIEKITGLTKEKIEKIN